MQIHKRPVVREREKERVRDFEFRFVFEGWTNEKRGYFKFRT